MSCPSLCRLYKCLIYLRDSRDIKFTLKYGDVEVKNAKQIVQIKKSKFMIWFLKKIIIIKYKYKFYTIILFNNNFKFINIFVLIREEMTTISLYYKNRLYFSIYFNSGIYSQQTSYQQVIPRNSHFHLLHPSLWPIKFSCLPHFSYIILNKKNFLHFLFVIRISTEN